MLLCAPLHAVQTLLASNVPPAGSPLLPKTARSQQQHPTPGPPLAPGGVKTWQAAVLQQQQGWPVSLAGLVVPTQLSQHQQMLLAGARQRPGLLLLLQPASSSRGNRASTG
jgi:hypothetical protein